MRQLQVDKLSSVACDISCPIDDEPFVYILGFGVLVQHRLTRRHIPTGCGDNCEPQLWDIVGRYKTDITAPFWVVQVASREFVVVDSTNRLVHFADRQATDLARFVPPVTITHAGRTATITSRDIAFELPPAGITTRVGVGRPVP